LKLILVEDAPFRTAVVLDDPLKKLLSLNASTGTLLESDSAPCYYSGSDFRFRLPAYDEVEPGTFPSAALESPSETTFVYPPIPSLVEALMNQARRPESYGAPWSVTLSSRPVTMLQARGPDGEALLSALVDPDAESARWRGTVAAVYRLRWNGTPVTVLMAGRVHGGLGRLARALQDEPGPWVGVARGGLLDNPFNLPELRGPGSLKLLEKLGLKYSSVSSSEIRRWKDVQDYRSSNPDGIRFLSANLAYSTAPASLVFPASSIVEVGGLKVAVIGLTPISTRKYLRSARLDHLTVVDPRQALESRVPQLRALADAVVVLAQNFEDETWLSSTRGVDLIVGEVIQRPTGVSPTERSGTQRGRRDFEPPFWTARLHYNAMTVLEADVVDRDSDGADWSLIERHRLLDDSVDDKPGMPDLDLNTIGVTVSTEAALIPSGRRIFGEGRTLSGASGARAAWTMAAGLLAQELNAEVGLLRVTALPVEIDDDIAERVARVWYENGDQAVRLSLKGSDLKPLLAEAAIQRQREERGQPLGVIAYTVGGVGADQSIHGVSIDDAAVYQVAASQVLADALGLPEGRPVAVSSGSEAELVVSALRKRQGSAPERYKSWMEGRPVEARGLWRVNFRDVGLNIQNTKVVRDDAFNSVPNSRIQGFDELLIGGAFKADAEYVRKTYRWNNTVELEYARSRLRPRNAPAVTNTTANRIFASTTGTRRAGVIRQEWFAKQWGPSLGLQYDSQFEAAPGLKRKQIYSVLPGLSFLDGTWIRRFEIAGNIKRDLSREPPNTQSGLFTKLILSHDVGPGPVRVQGELWGNYFFRTNQDTAQDLLYEGDANLKLRVPIRKHLSIAPFVDFYWFGLKTVKVWGYSAMMGVQIGFSRLWKPQYEPLLGSK
jgi:hypothetical protein